MLLLHQPILEAADAAAKALDRAKTLSVLRNLGLDDFGKLLFSLPLARYPNLTEMLPRMVSPEAQQSWTGATGDVLLSQSLGTMRTFETIFWRNAGRALSTARILDFGCGYGRLLRLMYFHQDPSLVFGCDPWEKSIALCQQAGLTENIAQTSYLPEDLPYPDQSFDFIYAFSVFTHLSERATRQSLTALRKKIKKEGVLVITIRPVEYWAYAKEHGLVATPGALRDRHLEHGFAFAPHNRAPLDGDITYGDTTMSPEFLSHQFPQWRAVSIERQLSDCLQLIVTLVPS